MSKFIRFLYNKKVAHGRIIDNNLVMEIDNFIGEYKDTGKIYESNQIQLLSPCQPSKIIGVGLNYRTPDIENEQLPETPILFFKPSTTVITTEDNIIKWPQVNDLTFEGELAVVIGKEAHCVSESGACEYILGYTVANDVTARDLQRVDNQWTRSKSFDSFLPLGPVIKTGIDWENLTIKTYLNGEKCQEGNTSQLIFNVPWLISYISNIMTLLPGDVILTGTPGGYGGTMNVGDYVVVEIDEIGKLGNNVKDIQAIKLGGISNEQ